MPPLVTVMEGSGAFDEKGMRRHVRHIIDSGVHGISPTGSTGEFITMDMDEQKRVIDVVIDEAAGAVQVYAGTGSYSTDRVIELSEHAEKQGADGLLIINPYYIQPPVADVMNHYRAIREAVSIPIMLYQNPHVCGYQLSNENLVTLVDEGAIQSVKLANGPAHEVVLLKAHCGERVQAIYGADPEAPEALLAGADGWITSFINVAPRLCKKMYDATVDGDVKKTYAIWAKLLPFLEFAYSGKVHWLQCVKTSLDILNRSAGPTRLPTRLLEGASRDELASILERMNAE